MADVTVKREDELDTAFGGAFRLARHSLGLSSFGLQILQMPPNADGYPVHDHGEDGQEECYIAIAGSAELIVGDETHTLEPGVLARVGSGQERKVVPGDDGIKLIVVGGVPGKAYEIPDFTVPKQDG